jgi:hypothetical protein
MIPFYHLVISIPKNAGSYNFSAFNTDVASPSFGMWNGTVSDPRNIQFGLKLLF